MIEKLDLWEELKYATSQIGNTILKPQQQELFIGGGNPDANILILGDDPELYLNEQLKTREGSSGEFLCLLLEYCGISKEDIYISTLSKRNARLKDFMPEDHEKLQELLNFQIGLLTPKVIVCLGYEAAQMLLDREIHLEEDRKHIFEWKAGIQVFVTYDVTTVKKARAELGKKAKIALDFRDDLKKLEYFKS